MAHAVIDVALLTDDFSDRDVLEYLRDHHPEVFRLRKGICIPPGSKKVIATAFKCSCGNEEKDKLRDCRRYVKIYSRWYLLYTGARSTSNASNLSLVVS